MAFLFYFSHPALLSEAEQRPFSVSPAVMSSLLQNLSRVNRQYVDIDRPLFARYVAGIRAPMNKEDIDQQKVEETR